MAYRKHITSRATFALCVDDFGVKVFNKEYQHHLINTFQQYYTISINNSRCNYCGLNIKWNYQAGYVTV
eukprot:14941260-Ditylum_brightwellii.AAC.1